MEAVKTCFLTVGSGSKFQLDGHGRFCVYRTENSSQYDLTTDVGGCADLFQFTWVLHWWQLDFSIFWRKWEWRFQCKTSCYDAMQLLRCFESLIYYWELVARLVWMVARWSLWYSSLWIWLGYLLQFRSKRFFQTLYNLPGENYFEQHASSQKNYMIWGVIHVFSTNSVEWVAQQSWILRVRGLEYVCAIITVMILP